MLPRAATCGDSRYRFRYSHCSAIQFSRCYAVSCNGDGMSDMPETLAACPDRAGSLGDQPAYTAAPWTFREPPAASHPLGVRVGELADSMWVEVHKSRWLAP